MNCESMVANQPDRFGAAFRGAFVALAAAIILAAPAARAADPGGKATAGKSPAVAFETLPGTTAKRVILGAKAAERLGIETGTVGEKRVVRKLMVGGLVIPPMEKPPKPKAAGGVFAGILQGTEDASPRFTPVGFAGFRNAAATSGLQPAAPEPQPAAPRAASTASGDVWVLVTLSPAEWERLAKDKPARLLPLETRTRLKSEILARPTGWEPLEDMKRSMLSLYYMVPGKRHGLTVNHRMRVELQLSGSEEKRKVVPYGAVYYDGKGDAWVYVNTQPLTYERRRVGVELVEGDLAVLSDGPAVGTPVVSVGAALLYGAEVFGK